MDPVDNPFNAGAGTKPPALVGRDAEIEHFATALKRLAKGRPDQQLMVTGLRGVGKTVLLKHLEGVATELGWKFLLHEVSPEEDFRLRIASLCERALLKIAPPGALKTLGQHARRLIGAFKVTYNPDGSVTGQIDPGEPGMATSGLFEDHLTDLLEAIGQAAKEEDTGVVFALDELHELNNADLAAILAAIHRVSSQNELPIFLVAAGLPQLVQRSVAVKGYSERLFLFAELGELSSAEVDAAIRVPAEDESVTYTDEAIEKIFELSSGYPYFVQLFGKLAWNTSEDPVDLSDIIRVAAAVEIELDSQFYLARTSLATEDELMLLRAMVEQGGETFDAKEAALRLKISDSGVDHHVEMCVRNQLIYLTVGGKYAFTVPHFDRHLKRRIPDCPPR